MAGRIVYSAPTTYTTSIAGAGVAPSLKNLAIGASLLSNAIDNATDKYPYIDLDLYIKTASAASGSPYINLFFLYAIDGTNYEDGSASVAPAKAADVVIPIRLTTNQQRIALANIPIGPYLFKVLFTNNTGVALANTDNLNVLSHRFHGHQIA